MHLKQYLENQRKEMVKYKWCKGEQIGRDPGESAYKEWVEKYAKIYREEYNHLYNKVLDVVTESVTDDIKSVVSHCSCQDPNLVRNITKKVIEAFISEWINEKLSDPNNPHLDEI